MDKNDLVGSWRLLSWEIIYAGQRPVTHPFGERPVGLLIYSADGMMSAVINRRQRDAFTGGSARQAADGHKIAAFDSYFSYAGPYRVVDDHVIHTVAQSLNPAMVGTKQIRHMTFAGDHLTLSADEPTGRGDETRHHRLVWQKVKP